MKLDVRERLVLLSVLPAEGNFVTLKVVRKLRESLSFSEEEIKGYKFVYGVNQETNQNQVTWDNSIEQSKSIEIGTQAKTIIQDALKKLDEQEKLRDEHFTLCVKFLGKD